ncbi:hypothetical protein OG203_13925 [Nocardia sp. NBC_01499]|uniref:MAB_1171c family putative transporter n=1 Tax=Nocardia sp. NBC_01499 TaxID=2903597 RepID=UPI00386C0572
MTSPISGSIAWLVIGYVAIVAVGRVLFTRDTVIDRLVNRLPVWCLIGLVLYRCTPTPSVSSVTNELALGCIVMLGMYLYGMARLWESGPEGTWRRQRVYCAIAVGSALLIVLAGPAAGSAGRLSEQLNWGGIVVWTAFAAPQAATAVIFARLCIRELRGGKLGPLARAFCYLMLLAFLPFWIDLALFVFQLILGWDYFPPHIVRAELIFTSTAVVASTLIASPVVELLLAQAGWDRDGRICHRLRPLWRAVTAAVPEVVMSAPSDRLTRGDSTARLLRMIVEIRDALLHLGPYLPNAVSAPLDGPDREIKVYACRLASAVRARKAGLRPMDSDPVPQTFLTAQDFDTELRQLLELARVWSAARAAPKVVTGDR